MARPTNVQRGGGGGQPPPRPAAAALTRRLTQVPRRRAAAAAAYNTVIHVTDADRNVTPAAAAAAAGPVLNVTAAVAGRPRAGAALAELLAAALRGAGLRALAVPPPPACRAPAAPDALACRDAMLVALAAGSLHAAVLHVPASAAPAAWLLRDLGLDDFGDVTPPTRRACLRPAALSEPAAPATRPARSLLDLADEDVARNHQIHERLLDAALHSANVSLTVGEGLAPPWCATVNATCALALTSDLGEAAVLLAAAERFRLRLRVLPLGRQLPAVATALGVSAPLLCDWAPEWSALAGLHAVRLGPPPCPSNLDLTNDSSADCPFESLRLMKLANIRALTHSTRAVRALVRLALDADEMRELTRRVLSAEPPEAARAFLAAHPRAERRGEVRVAVMVPGETAREAYWAPALAAAAELLEADLEAAGEPRAARLKVELYDDRCDARRAYRYVFRALGAGEFGALSAVAGPACAAPFAELARLSPAHALPLLAYSPQVSAGGAAALLAAGDARDASAALDALARRLHWRRLAALSEGSARAALDSSRLRVPVDVHVELPDPLPDDDGQIFHDLRRALCGVRSRDDKAAKCNLREATVRTVMLCTPHLPEANSQEWNSTELQWAARAAAGAAGGARVLLVAAEDARAVRAALCAGWRAGLAPAAGSAWLLPATLPPGWLRAARADRPACAQHELDAAADGHLSFVPEWLAAWRGETDTGARAPDLNISAWRERWRTRCAAWARRVGDGGAGRCASAAPLGALLYDALRLWAAALDRLLTAQPDRLADLHDPDTVRSLVANATGEEYVGLTGRFEWVREGAGAARVAPLVLLQWENGTRRTVGRWQRAGELQLLSPRWRTPDAEPPGDGSEHCALRPLAELLRADCRAAGVALAALLLVLSMAALAAAALHCKRRAEREYRGRLAALALRTIPATPAKTEGLDRWEVPRERVVINRKLGMGAFGTVYGGHALLSRERGWTAVAVKTLKAGATTEEKLDFLSEAEAMKRFDHKNIVRLLGVVTKTEPVCTVMEFMLYGDLKNYLLARRHLAGAPVGGDAGGETGGEADEVSARRLTGMARDAARALAYLAQLRYVHRDVAARNCLVSARRVLKLADFGMTRLVFDNDYYRFSRKGMLPVRWMAPESLALGIFSPASDVWAFGVLLYEIVTFGSLPFQGLSNAEVLARVKAGHTADLPAALRPELEELITWCWQRERGARPTAAQLAARLQEAPQLLQPCLDVPLDALPLAAEPPWRAPPERAAARWLSWAAPVAPPAGPASAHTDTTYLSADPRDTDRFLP
ncbi:uncharacterized protein [Battus philenor]|uniref:uncharacterized protein n=1 Tax=Battus philenor TaxID=42288 RepID=UPI0035D0E815